MKTNFFMLPKIDVCIQVTDGEGKPLGSIDRAGAFCLNPKTKKLHTSQLTDILHVCLNVGEYFDELGKQTTDKLKLGGVRWNNG